jgi:hypothetical protein
VAALISTPRLVVAVGLQEALMEVRQAGAIDRLDDVGAEVDTRHELDAVVPEPFHETDEREDASHRAACPVPEQELGLLLAGEEVLGNHLGAEYVGGMVERCELFPPPLDGRQSMGRAGREILPRSIEPTMEQAAAMTKPLSERWIGEQLVPRVGERHGVCSSARSPRPRCA